MKKVKQFIKNLPVVGNLLFSLRKALRGEFSGSVNYWEQRYAQKGNSGAGSYNRLAEFKAEIINSFVKENNLKNIIEFGCGDGNQLSLAEYPSYIGFDVSSTAIKICKEKFKNDNSKSFFIYDSLAYCDNSGIFKADLTLSLDVIFHLVEDEIFDAYMTHLFNSSKKFVIIYSSNYQKEQDYHEKDRNFMGWIESNKTNWRLLKKIENKYPYNIKDPENTSKADFYLLEKINPK